MITYVEIYQCFPFHRGKVIKVTIKFSRVTMLIAHLYLICFKYFAMVLENCPNVLLIAFSVILSSSNLYNYMA
jgi:hypothetical protein